MPSKCAKNSTGERPRHLYEYAIIRFVPDVERGETVNVGLILMCKRARKVFVRTHIDKGRIESLSPSVDFEALGRQLESFGKIAKSESDGGSIATLEAHERFRWLTAVRSACLQTERPHAGLTDDLESTFERLFETLVL